MNLSFLLTCVDHIFRLYSHNDSKPLKERRVATRFERGVNMARSRSKFSPKQGKGKHVIDARSLTCGQTMAQANTIFENKSMAEVLQKLTTKNLDHLMVVDYNYVPLGRLHAVDVLKLISKKTVNRSIAWMHGVPAGQILTNPPLTVKEKTPLLKAAVLMLTHDLNQLPVVDEDGALVGVVGHKTVARHIPKFVL